MTISLTTEQGTFEGETIQEVQRAASKAKRRALKQEIQEESDRKQARLYAQQNGYRLLAR